MINQIRAFLLERGLVFAQSPAKLKTAMGDVLENAEADLTPRMRNLQESAPRRGAQRNLGRRACVRRAWVS